MKYFKEEDYKGYKIVIRGEFKESTIAYESTKVYYDSVNLDMYIKNKFGREIHQELKTVETRREERNRMYKEVNESVGKLYANAKAIVDKKDREKEMTNGLPESLLAEEKEVVKEESINITFNISSVNGDTSNVEGFAKKIADSLKRQQGLR